MTSIEHIAATLDVDPASLVDYGRTLIVRPGTRVRRTGDLLTGHQAAVRLAGSGAMVAPVAVTYARGRMPSLGEVDADLDRLAAEVDSFGARPGQIARLHRTYTRVSARYRRAATLALLPRRGKARKEASRLFAKLQKVWSKMRSRGVPTTDLSSPDTIRREIEQGGRVLATRAAARSPSAPTSMPYPTSPYPNSIPAYEDPAADSAWVDEPAPADHSTYLADQAALERDLARIMPSYGAHEHRMLVDDLRGEVVGYPFSGLEHDHYGLAGSDAELIFTDPDDIETIEDGGLEDDIEVDDVVPAKKVKEAEGRTSDDGDTMSDVDRTLALVSTTAKALSPEDKKTLARTRGRAARNASRAARTVSDTANVARTLLPLVQAITERFGAESPHGGIDYRRLRPATSPQQDPVILIGIVRPEKAHVGRVNVSPWRPAAPEALSPLQALRAHQRFVHPSEMIRGSGAARWPFGNAAPLPPPRAPGEEVLGG